jgi:predicted transcriptional regulator
MATSIKIDDELKNRVRQLADIKKRSAHWIMCEAIREYIEREEKKERFKQEALTSWKAYQETGKHLTAQEVQNWLQTWGSEKETEIPPCHD